MSVRQVFELARRASLPSVGIVCTRSDVRPLSCISLRQYADSEQDIKEDEAARDWTGQRADKIKTLIKKRKERKRKIAELKADLESEDDSTDDEHQLLRNKQLMREIRSLEYDICWVQSLLRIPADRPLRKSSEKDEFAYALSHATIGCTGLATLMCP